MRLGRVLAAVGGLSSLVAASLTVVVMAAPAGAADSDGGAFRTAWTTVSTSHIDLSSNVTLGCTSGGNGVAVRNSPTAIVVDGHGFSLTQTCTTGSNNGVLEQDGEGGVTLQNLTITGGRTSGTGGGVNLQLPVSAPLTIDHSTITNNLACGVGGGIAHRTTGNVVIRNSTFSNNTSATDGGGIDVDDGQLTVINSTITGNKSVDGEGGIDSDASTVGARGVNLVYTTLVGNITDGGLTCPLAAQAATPSKGSPPKVHAQASTFDANLFTSEEETFQSFGTVIANPILLNHPGNNVANCIIQGAATSQGFNFATDTSCIFTASTDNQSTTNNPNLGSLANNGGPTQTMLPLSGSPLIDAIPHTSCQVDGATGITIDQRDLPRPDPKTGLCDIGAVEVQPPAPSAPTAVVITPRFTG